MALMTDIRRHVRHGWHGKADGHGHAREATADDVAAFANPTSLQISVTETAHGATWSTWPANGNDRYGGRTERGMAAPSPPPTYGDITSSTAPTTTQAASSLGSQFSQTPYPKSAQWMMRTPTHGPRHPAHSHRPACT